MKKEEKIQIRIQKEFKEELKEHAENQNEPMSIWYSKAYLCDGNFKCNTKFFFWRWRFSRFWKCKKWII